MNEIIIKLARIGLDTLVGRELNKSACVEKNSSPKTDKLILGSLLALMTAATAAKGVNELSGAGDAFDKPQYDGLNVKLSPGSKLRSALIDVLGNQESDVGLPEA